MIQYHVYPGGKKRIVTFSYDDGRGDDARLIEMFDRYGVKGTFHLNGINYQGANQAELQIIREQYAGHEVACHTLQHGWPERMPPVSVVNEVLRDRITLEQIVGYPVQGMSYPSGSYNEPVKEALRACGIVYSRTTRDTMNFHLPKDFLEWHPTCHHRNGLEMAERFMGTLDSPWVGPLLYIWGHSHEFTSQAAWDDMENIVKCVAGNDKIWYATNMEIYDYMMAQRSLKISADEHVFYNPSSIPVYVERDKRDIIRIGPGERLVR